MIRINAYLNEENEILYLEEKKRLEYLMSQKLTDTIVIRSLFNRLAEFIEAEKLISV